MKTELQHERQVAGLKVPPDLMNEWNAAISRGMDALDKFFGDTDWITKIDADTLDLNDPFTCVCGQLFEMDAQKLREENGEFIGSGYDYAVRYVVEHGADGPSYALEDSWSVHHGFNVKDWVELENRELDMDEYILTYNGIGWDQDPGMWGVHWELFTKLWVERLEKRKAELGLMSDG